ncbi:metalloregulator ArsR/SmtB family transcription factor [Pusillimonas sp. SM2304]|uniref:ArsR/SmtB family transcription factor n=1 Tax=Pusillimonas sp. SM2304 TaxID=3073241 RepID=UPI002874F0C9|nr:metalloregulator ArsR/SmtB family transcription factor [Pusillimonas sp. SM2304]MDS1142280.1 metalloregulator ArsR/SmtB family transcription factor [Pusillimonas sp. SM2304]
MSQSRPKETIFSKLAELAQAIGHPHRLELLECLAQAQHNVEELAQVSGLTAANTSRHLQILRRARLVAPERQGKYVLYSLDGHNEVSALLKALRCVGERNLAEAQQLMQDYFSNRGALEPVTQEELFARLQDGAVTLVDVRPEHEYADGHLPGALNIPLDQLEKHLSRLSMNREIVAYCRGPHCVLSKEAVSLLQSKGFRARRLKKGFPGWKAAGYKIETAAA